MLKTDRGFSLIELMIVVAIISVLGSIAVPNYQLFAGRARQSEAKGSLSAIFAAEQGFRAEYNVFSACLIQAGYKPSGNKRYYLTGFLNGSSSSSDQNGNPCNLGAAVTDSDGVQHNDATFLQTNWANPALNGQEASTPFMCNVADFKALAGGSISGSSPVLDIWSITDNRILTNEQSGL